MSVSSDELEQRLFALNLKEWRVKQTIIQDWYDGPREGLCSLLYPDVEFLFELLCERRCEDGLDDRLFKIAFLPPGSIEDALRALGELGAPSGPIWVPMWRFKNDDLRVLAEQKLSQIRAKSEKTDLVLYAKDMKTFLGLWKFSKPHEMVKDWFSELEF